jgi:hypothetical protein
MVGKILCVVLGFAMSFFSFALPAGGAEVVQGKCVEYNDSADTIRLEEFDTNFSKEAPYGVSRQIVSVFDCSNAKIGIPPEPGDILRIVYTSQGKIKKAIKVMNVSKQELKKK